MKTNKKISIVTLCLLFGLAISCKESFLETTPYGAVTEATLQANETGANSLLISAYSNLDGFSGWDNGNPWGGAASNWTFGSVAGGDAYKGSEANDQPDITPIELHQTNSNNPYLEGKWRNYYDGILRTNQAITAYKKLASTPILDAIKKLRIAEARFLRGFYHLELTKVFGKVPYITEDIVETRIANDKDIMPDIQADFTAAIADLPVTQPEAGRVTKGAAQTFLGYTYMWQKKYAEAKAQFGAVIASGRYSLNTNFHDNFNPAFRNTREGILEVQQAVNVGTDDNANNGDVLNFPYNGGPGGCCGFHQPSQNLVNAFRTNPAGFPLLDTYNDADAFVTDQGISGVAWGATTKYLKDAQASIADPAQPNVERVYKSLTGVKDAENIGKNPLTNPSDWVEIWRENVTVPLDPRLDYTVGRRAVPYLDWGNHPGVSWIRDQIYGGPYSPIKNVYYKSQEGTYTTVTGWTKGFNSNNIKLMRYADLLLLAAEAEVELNNLDAARLLVNQVRNRAKTGSYVKDGVVNAANYVINTYGLSEVGYFDTQTNARKAVRFERRVELGMEGHRFFDLVRQGIVAAEKAAYFAKEKTKRSYFANGSFTAGKHEVFPIPQGAINASSIGGQPMLKQNPGY